MLCYKCGALSETEICMTVCYKVLLISVAPLRSWKCENQLARSRVKLINRLGRGNCLAISKLACEVIKIL